MPRPGRWSMLSWVPTVIVGAVIGLWFSGVQPRLWGLARSEWILFKLHGREPAPRLLALYHQRCSPDEVLVKGGFAHMTCSRLCATDRDCDGHGACYCGSVSAECSRLWPGRDVSDGPAPWTCSERSN